MRSRAAADSVVPSSTRVNSAQIGSGFEAPSFSGSTMLRRFITNYIARHQHPVNQWLHVVGVPLTFVASIAMLILGEPWWALGCFVAGYALQFAGHAVEGNDAGEVVLIKRWLGRPYVEFAPGRNRESSGSR